jgi:diguanylate cyclase (GGDEF)-like protein
MTASILIVEDEDDIAQLVAINLQAEGFSTRVASRGDDAVDVAVSTRPDLVVLDLMLPGIDGVEVCRQLRKDPRTASTGIIMLTARTLPSDRIAGLEAGADDYVDKPFDPGELVARVQTALRRNRQLRATSPLTGLPGNFEIEARLDARLADGDDFALLHIDLDNFKAYNDHYGFLRGDRAIVVTANTVVQAATEVPEASAFVGHIGGDDFAVVCDALYADALAQLVVERFDDQVPELYDEGDRDAGYIEYVDRSGDKQRHAFLTVSIGVASTLVRPFTSAVEAASIAVELKRYAKAVDGSAWRMDRRRG